MKEFNIQIKADGYELDTGLKKLGFKVKNEADLLKNLETLPLGAPVELFSPLGRVLPDEEILHVYVRPDSSRLGLRDALLFYPVAAFIMIYLIYFFLQEPFFFFQYKGFIEYYPIFMTNLGSFFGPVEAKNIILMWLGTAVLIGLPFALAVYLVLAWILRPLPSRIFALFFGQFRQ